MFGVCCLVSLGFGGYTLIWFGRLYFGDLEVCRFWGLYFGNLGFAGFGCCTLMCLEVLGVVFLGFGVWRF